MSGFNELIPQELINVFDERELEVGGCAPRGADSLAPHRGYVRDRRGRLAEAYRLPWLVS